MSNERKKEEVTEIHEKSKILTAVKWSKAFTVFLNSVIIWAKTILLFCIIREDDALIRALLQLDTNPLYLEECNSVADKLASCAPNNHP